MDQEPKPSGTDRNDGGPREGVWRRRVTVPGTQRIYRPGVQHVQARHALTDTSSPAKVGTAVDQEPVSKFPSDTGIAHAQQTGCSHVDAAWSAQLCRVASRAPHHDTFLGLKPRRFLELFHLARATALVEPAHPHQLRHGGASADAMHGNTDAALMERGSWSSTRSVARYRKPARYIRLLSLLSASQRAQVKTAPVQIVEIAQALLLKMK